MPGWDWNVEVTPALVDALRSLPRDERARVAARLDDLARHGPPPALAREADARGVIRVPAGRSVLSCLQDLETRTLYVVGLRPERESVGALVGRLFHRSVPAWMKWGGGNMGGGGWVRDLTFAVRSLRRSPGFALVAVFTLALGIGATAAIFSVANGVLLKPLPYGHADAVVTFWASWDNFPDKTWLSEPEYRFFHQENRTLEDLALYAGGGTNFTSVEAPEQVRSAWVTPNTFQVLDVTPVVGRFFTWDEARLQVPGVVLGYDVWVRRFGGDPGIVGADVELDGAHVPVLGVLPQGFAMPVDFGAPSPFQVYRPLYVDLESPAPDLGVGGNHGYYAVGRLRDGVTLEEARADFQRVMSLVTPVGLYRPARRFAPRLFLAKDDIVGSARGTILVLLGAVGLVLLIACGNVANLMLSRSETRTREVAVRVALGAGRMRVLRQLMAESLVLSAAAGVLGVALASLGVRTLLAIDPDAVPRAAEVSVDGPVLLFTFLVSVLTAFVFGLVPAWRTSRAGVAGTLHDAGRGGGGGRKSNGLQGLLIATQMAMAVVLLVGSGLMIRTFVGLLRVDPGFGAENVLTVRVTPPRGAYPDATSLNAFYDDVLRRVREIPGVRSAGGGRILPLASTMGDSGFRPVGYERRGDESTQAEWQWATPGFVETMGIRLVEGRTFDEGDLPENQPVVLINQAAARRYWGDESPLGRAVVAGGAPDTAVVVGVVGNVIHNGITSQAKPRYYVPYAQVDEDWVGNLRSIVLTVATEGDPRRYLDAVSKEVRALNPSVPLAEVRTLDEVVDGAVAQPRFAMVLLGSFAAIALTLAVMGIYGVLSYAVSRRTQEIGIRMALGAERGTVVGMVVRQGMVMALTGVAFGTVIALAMSGFMSGMLYGVGAQDPGTFVAVPLVFVAVALAACWIPASRAARVLPSTALRYE